MVKKSSNLYIGMYKYLFLLALVVMVSENTYSKVTWYLQAGGIWGKSGAEVEIDDYSTVHEDMWNEWYHKEIKSGYEVAAGLYMQIPVQNDRMFIDTGLGWRMKSVLSSRDFYFPPNPNYGEYGNFRILNYQGRMNFLELPVRFCYQLNIDEKNSFQFKLGPYVSYALGAINKEKPDIFGDDRVDPKQTLSPITAGLSPSVMFKHRAIAIGATMNTPCIFNGLRDVKGTTFNLVIAVHLGSTSHWDWDAIADGMSAVGNSLQTIADTYSEYQQGNASQYDSSSSTSGSSTSSSYRNNSEGKSNNFSSSEQQSYTTDKRTYERYDSQLASHFAGNQVMSQSSVKQAQKEMKRLREKWEKRGKSFPKVENETRR